MGSTGYKNFEKLNEMFKSGFGAAFANISNPEKNDIFMYFDNIYRVWYYSALFREGFASPAIFAGIWLKETEGENVCIPRINDGAVDFEWRRYTVGDHPFVQDLYKIVEIVEDGASFDRVLNELIPEDFPKYAGRFTLNDNCYIAYLMEISLELGIIKKIPSVYIMKYRATAKGLNLDQLDSKTALEKVIDCAAKICVRKFSNIFGTSPALNKSLPRHWLTGIDLTDDIYADLYDTVGVDIISLWRGRNDEDNDLYDELDKAALSSVYPIGRLIDRYFLTPFGRYLQLIQPIYYSPFHFGKELEYVFRSGIRDDFDNSLAIFCPSSIYRLTSLGRELITADKKETPFILTDRELEDYLDIMMKHSFYEGKTNNNIK